MKSLMALPEAMRAPINSRAEAEAFMRSLKSEGLDYHFDDGAIDCLHRNGLVDEAAAMWIDSQIDACYRAFEASGADLREDCPIGFMLKLMDEAGELPDGALA
jgi:hypothetical protein